MAETFMSGIYIHIPFCRKACHYCNFHFSTNLTLVNDVVDAICIELANLKSYLSEEVKTIYLGGGTPSVLSFDQLQKILMTIRQNFQLDPREVTLECNPEDIDIHQLNSWQELGIDRLSIGIQSFFDEHLVWMNRSHTGAQAKHAVKMAIDCGYTNISADLIYGFSSLTAEQLTHNIEQLANLNIPHISAYNLTIEPKTALQHQTSKGLYHPMSDIASNDQMAQLINAMDAYAYSQYEVSNFARTGFEALHNSNYWEGQSYLGVGPGAHSFNGTIRRWNISNNKKYHKSIYDQTVYYQEEELSLSERYNEFIMLNLRRRRGIVLSDLKKHFPSYMAHFHSQLAEMDSGYFLKKEDSISLTRPGLFLADQISSNLFMVH